MADKKLMRYSTSTVMGVAVHTVSERGDWVKYEDAAKLEDENKRLSEENERLQGQIDDVADALGCKEKTSHRHSHGRCLYAGISKIEHDWAALVVAEKRKLTAALEVLKAVEWGSIDDTGDFCPKCQWEKSAGHAAGCILAAVLNNGGATDGR